MTLRLRYATTIVAFTSLIVSHEAARSEIRPVRDVQKALSDQGFAAGSPDGIWGAKSVNALKGFQEAHALPKSGVITQDTLRALFPSTIIQAPAAPSDNDLSLNASISAQDENPKSPTTIANDVLTPATQSNGQAPSSAGSGNKSGSGGYLVAVFLAALGVLALRGRGKRTRK